MDFAFVCEEQQEVVRASHEQMSNWIFVVRGGSFDPFTTTMLSFINIQRSTFDVTTLRHRHYHRLFSDESFLVIVPQFFVRNCGATFVWEACLEFFHVGADDSPKIGFIG